MATELELAIMSYMVYRPDDANSLPIGAADAQNPQTWERDDELPVHA